MRRHLVSLAAVALTLGAATSSFAASDSFYRYHHRGRFENTRNDNRIEQGIRSGELTPREVALLERQQMQVMRMRERARMNGHVSAAERARISFAESRFDARIWQLKHNNRRVNPS